MLRRAVDSLLSRAEQDEVAQAIGRAEAGTSGEIKVHVETRCKGGADAVARARALLHRLKLDRMPARNGVIVYVAVHDRRFAVVGDTALASPAWQARFEQAAQTLAGAFGRAAYREGLLAIVEELGRALAAEFPAPAGSGPHPVSNRISGR
jgi:uncharacterized membrane protein